MRKTAILKTHNVPLGAKSLALILHDPDAPIAGGFTHWVVWNIDPATQAVKEESIPPEASEGLNGAGKVGYIGPCPPSGAHHYEFRIYALDVPFELSARTTARDLETEIEKHLLEKTELTGLYKRNGNF